MNRILIDTTDVLTLPLGADFIGFSGQNTEEAIHDFILANFDTQEERTFIIPVQIGEDPTLGLRFAMHIRCTGSLPDKVRYSPLILLYQGNYEELVSIELKLDRQFFSLLIQTTGIYLAKPMDALNIYDSCISTTADKWKTELRKLPVFASEKDHNHSIANEWGAHIFRLISGDQVETALFKKLHYKYLYNLYELDKIKQSESKLQLSKDIKLLLIDDNEKMWSEALGRVIPANQLESIPYENDFKKYKKNIIDIVNKDEYDIIFLDLRLDKAEENVHKQANEYSGFQILQKIKEINKGTQVIVMTASNKAWNMKALLDIGADGYYIKESPEYYNEKSAYENHTSFLETIKECQERVYLRKLSKLNKILGDSVKKSLLKEIDKNDFEKMMELYTFDSSLCTKLEMVLEMLGKNKPSDKSKYFRHSFLLLYQLLEDYAGLEFIYIKGDDNRISSKVNIKNGNFINVFGLDPKSNENIPLNFILFRKGKYFYQSRKDYLEKLNIFFKPKQLDTSHNNKSLSKETTLFKILSVFKERHQFSEQQCNELIEMTYLRSNLCGHETGNIDTNERDINQKDIENIYQVLMHIKD